MNLVSSITGFHNPRKHKGLSPEQFLLTYLKRQAGLIYKKPTKPINELRVPLVIFILSHWDKWVEEVKRLFPNTLKGN